MYINHQPQIAICAMLHDCSASEKKRVYSYWLSYWLSLSPDQPYRHLGIRHLKGFNVECDTYIALFSSAGWWNYEPSTGGVELADIPIRPEKRLNVRGMRVRGFTSMSTFFSVCMYTCRSPALLSGLSNKAKSICMRQRRKRGGGEGFWR